MIRIRFYLYLVLLLTLGNLTNNAQNASQSRLLREVAEICGTSNHEPADCQILHQAAQEFGIESLDSLVNMLEGRILDKGNSHTIAAMNDLLSYAEQHFGLVSQEAVVCKRRIVSAWWAKDWEKTRQLAEENEKCATSLLKKHPKDKSIKLLSVITQLELLTILKNRNQDNPEHWAKIIQIEKELEPYLKGKITYSSDLVDCCQLMANYKANSSTWSEYVNRLIQKVFPDGTYFEGCLDSNEMFSNALAFMEHAYEGATVLWNEHDLRRINVASDLAALQMRNRLEDYDTLHDKYIEWHTFLKEYLPEGDPMPDQIQLLMWECDVRYGQKLYEVRSPYPMLYRIEAFYGKESFAYLMTMFNLVNVTMMVNVENGRQLLKELQTIVDEQCESDDDLYGSYLMGMYWGIQAFANQSPEEYQAFVTRITDWYEKNHRASWESIYNGKQIANIYSTSLSLPDKAAELFGIVKSDVSSIATKESVLYTSVLENCVSCQAMSSNYDILKEGIEYCKELISIHEKLKYPSAKDYQILSGLHFSLGEKENGIQALRTGIDRSTLPEDRLWRCLSQLSLGWRLYSDMGVSLQDEPKQLFEEAIPFFKENVGQVGGAYIEGFCLISYYYNAIGQYEKAEETLKEGMELHEALYNEYDYLYIQMLNDLYTLYAQNLNEYDKAEQLLEGRLESIRQNPSFSMHRIVLQLLWDRYHLLSSKTDDLMLRVAALNEIQAEITLMAQLAGENASQLKDIAMPFVYEWLGMMPLYGNSLKEMEQVIKTNPSMVTDEQKDAAYRLKTNLLEMFNNQVLPELQLWLEELKGNGNYLDNYETLNLYTALANYYISLEQDTIKARSYYLQLIESNQPTIRIKARAELADLSMQQGHYKEAAQYYEQLKKEVDNTPQAIVSLEDKAGYCNAIGSAYIMCGRYKDAISSAREYFKLRQQQVSQNFDLLTQSEREAFIRNGGGGGGGILFLLPKFPEILAADGYNAMLASKGLLLRASERIKRGIINSGNKELQALTDSLNQLTTRFKTMNTMTDWEHGNYNYDPEVVKTRQQIEALERSINRQASQFIKGMNTPDWQQLQRVMNPGEAAVEFVLSDTTSLGALVLLPQGNPVYVPLTPTNELWNAMASVADMDGYQKAEALYVQDRLRLYDKIWKPMETVLQGIMTIYYSPTGFLNDLAFAAFKCEDGTYLADHYELHQMLSTGDLVVLRTKSDKENVQTALLYGSVFYSPEHEQVAQRMAEDASTNGHRGAVKDAFDYLPFTKYEICQVKDLLQSKQVKANSLIGFSSTEESLHAISEHSPDILHLSTHGFFVKGDKKAMENKFLARFPSMRFSSMQRSGLAFVDANQTWEGETNKPEESDGILTANEVALLDLSRTRLAVLSACQTAVGEYTTEGVYGMHRGFKQAGVRSILATLWNVNDRSTARLMELFYERWLSGIPMQQSLNEAVKELRKEYPSPFFWAPFVLMDAEN